ncbi:conserved hypothetical protein [Ricinus communis]|uniref:Uncharacterized protein n=1 Tax=Ricinus communis TaxID=3988 RepID=B9RSR1_RICCO|nr:conserved hypothetical protein [Ricinus communis]
MLKFVSSFLSTFNHFLVRSTYYKTSAKSSMPLSRYINVFRKCYESLAMLVDLDSMQVTAYNDRFRTHLPKAEDTDFPVKGKPNCIYVGCTNEGIWPRAEVL